MGCGRGGGGGGRARTPCTLPLDPPLKGFTILIFFADNRTYLFQADNEADLEA